MKKHHFFAYFIRMKYIDRWALMRNTSRENLSQHSAEVAAVAHALAVIGNKRLGKSYDCDRAATLGLYHDMPEIITGDLPTPVKYFDPEIRDRYALVESFACSRLLSTLPDDLRSEYEPLFIKDEDDGGLGKLVKAADKIAALIKCIEERKAGNDEFRLAEKSSREHIKKLACPEADIFIEEFLPSCELTLDQLN